MADFRTQAEELCKTVDLQLKEQTITLATAVFAMQAKIDDCIPDVASMELAQVTSNSNGDTVLKQNPEIAEFRALVKDYANALKALDEIIGQAKTPATISMLDTMRGKVISL